MDQSENQDNRKTISGKVEKVIFQNGDIGRSILSIVRKNGRHCRVIGNMTGIEIGSNISAIGTWQKDEKYGWQFMMDHFVDPKKFIDKNPYYLTFKVGCQKFKMVFVKSNDPDVGDFYIGRTPITQGQWFAIMDDYPSEFIDDEDYLSEDSVTWEESIKFAVKLSLATGRTFWLPTQEELMLASHGGCKSKETHPVAKKRPKELWLFDEIPELDEVDSYKERDEGITGLRIAIPSDKQIFVDIDKIYNHFGGYINTEAGRKVSLKQYYEESEDIDLHEAYQRMFYNVYEFGMDFDYDLVLILLKITEGSDFLRKELRGELSDWLSQSEF